MNVIHVAGHLGADPEERFTASGQKVITLRLAAKTRKNGKDDTIWWRVTIWGEQFSKMMPYLKKGSSIMVIGEFQKPDIYNDRDGKPQASMNITAMNIMFSPFGRTDKQDASQNKEGAFQANTSAGMATGAQSPSAPQAGSFNVDDEIPF